MSFVLCLQVRTVSSKYIMKCDDDTFVRVDAAFDEAKKVPEGRSLYIGNINYFHKPLRYGKWAVTYKVWKNVRVLIPLILLTSLLYLYNSTLFVDSMHYCF
jgi:hypothetical protein